MTSPAVAWMPLYVADYLRDTMHLTTEQHGAYMLLLMAAWSRGGLLPADPGQLAGMAKMSPAMWKRTAPILLPFFHIDGDRLAQKRVMVEFEKAQRMSETRRANGLKGGRPAKLNGTGKKATGSPQGKLNESVFALPSPSQILEDQESSNMARKRACRIPTDWKLSAEDRAYALAKGLSGVDDVAEGFAHYWAGKSGKDATKVDWSATWRNWVINQRSRQPNGHGSSAIRGGEIQ